MICPQCGAAAQPYDRFCIRCGHDMQPNGSAAPERGPAAATNPNAQPYASAAPVTPPYVGAAYGDSMGAPPAQQPYNNGAPSQGGWASGSSTPGPNPFGGPRSAPSNGTMLNGRPANAGGKGLFQGVGAAIVALFVVLGK
ncbi:MAG: zinc-ribbon domain-containing protein, partial [Chloroflexi bacterium]|nr:zinc-ribbon domain-containing protein [Chloroflexota bacterium]